MSDLMLASAGRGAAACAPRLVLILSAEMGEGHNAAASAITEAIAEVWPECVVDRADTWALWGEPFSRAAVWGYRVQMQLLPLTYEWFYDRLCRSDRFAALTKAAIGRFFGRRLERLLASRQDDLVISTYPFGSAALDWLRKRRGYDIPAVTYIPAFHVHPVWTYSGIDHHYVIYDNAAEHARTKGFDATMRIGAPPVCSAFGGLGKDQARAALGLGAEEFVVLVSGGAWALGDVDQAVRALVASRSRMRVIAVCGRAERLLQSLRSLGVPPERLLLYGYVDNMHELMAAADVVVTNGAGVTVLEALSTPRPVIAFRPLAGHGRASTLEMIKRDLALVADDVPTLVDAVAKLASDEVLLTRMEHAAREWVSGRDLRDSVREMEQILRSPRAGARSPAAGGALRRIGEGSPSAGAGQGTQAAS